MSLMTPTGILSFPNLFVARAAVPGGEPRFSLNLIFNDEAIKTAPTFGSAIAVRVSTALAP